MRTENSKAPAGQGKGLKGEGSRANRRNHADSVSEVKPLPSRIRKAGFNFEQIIRDGRWAVFRKRKPDWPESSPWCYEVLKIQVHSAGERFGKWFPATETLPSSEQWGKWGWSPADRKTAMELFREKTQERLAYDGERPIGSPDDSTTRRKQ